VERLPLQQLWARRAPLSFGPKARISLSSTMAQRHAFHLVDPSILPFITAISALCLTLGSVLFFHGYVGGIESTFFGLSGVLLCMFL
jgi:hypothetical protein